MEEYMAKREGDLDALIKAHRTYLDRVVKKVLLLSSKADKEEVLLDQVRSAMDCILQFQNATVRCPYLYKIIPNARMSFTHGRLPKQHD